MSDFKQQVRLNPAVAKVLVEYEKIYSKADALEQWNFLVDAILAAHNAELDRIAEGMKLINTELDLGISQMFMFNRAKRRQLAECQAYIKAQKGS